VLDHVLAQADRQVGPTDRLVCCSGLVAVGETLRAVSDSGPRRVLSGHTSELAEYLQSTVAAAVDGVWWAPDAPVWMKYVPAADQTRRRCVPSRCRHAGCSSG